jgi:hypothetical protein
MKTASAPEHSLMSSSPLSIPATNRAVDNPSAAAELSATTVALTSPGLAGYPVGRDSAHAEIRRLGASAYAQWQPRFPLLHIALIRWLATSLWLRTGRTRASPSMFASRPTGAFNPSARVLAYSPDKPVFPTLSRCLSGRFVEGITLPMHNI